VGWPQRRSTLPLWQRQWRSAFFQRHATPVRSIILGSGGDCCATNANSSQGTFYEGCMVTGYPSDATENAVQANIVAAGYSK